MGKEERELQMAFSRKEKNEKLLSNLEKLREEGSVIDEQYESMKSNYTEMINEATSAIEQIKNGLSRDLENEEKTLETYKQELKNLEVRFKVGELSADKYKKSEQKARSKIDREQASKGIGIEKVVDWDVVGMFEIRKEESRENLCNQVVIKEQK